MSAKKYVIDKLREHMENSKKSREEIFDFIVRRRLYDNPSHFLDSTKEDIVHAYYATLIGGGEWIERCAEFFRFDIEKCLIEFEHKNGDSFLDTSNLEQTKKEIGQLHTDIENVLSSEREISKYVFEKRLTKFGHIMKSFGAFKIVEEGPLITYSKELREIKECLEKLMVRDPLRVISEDLGIHLYAGVDLYSRYWKATPRNTIVFRAVDLED